MKFYEVGPNLSMTEHRDHHPADLLFREDFPRPACRPASGDPPRGKEAGAYGRQVESSEDTAKLEALEKAGS